MKQEKVRQQVCLQMSLILNWSILEISQILCVVMMLNFFRERLTDERHSTLFPARTIVRDSHSRK